MSAPDIQHRPVVSVLIRARNDSQRENLQSILSELIREDRAMTAKVLNGENIISGMGELHLEIICDRISREYKIPLDVGELGVIYLETIRKTAEAEGKYIRAISGSCMYGHVKIRLEPRVPGSGYEFVDEIKNGAIPSEFIEPANLGIQEAMKGGVLSGHEMVDLQAILYDGSYHLGDSNETAFKIAGSIAFKEAARKADPVVLEPIMSIEVRTPQEFVGAIVGDLSRRRGWIEGMERRADGQVIRATAPMATMIGYAQHMRSITQSMGQYSMNFVRYEEVPRGGDSGVDDAGVTANNPRTPKAGSGFAAAQWDEES
jgi:elongation factor G